MVYAYDKSLPMPVADLYDTQIMAMAVNAAKDMYEKGQQQIKDFQKDYGDFISPFAKDMARYGEMVGGVRDIINNLYANGIDPLRSAEGRAAVAQAIRSIDPAQYNQMKANAKAGYAYLDAQQKLRQSGKYSKAMEDYDIAHSGGVNFEDFETIDPRTGAINSWGRTSPIEAASLRDLTYKSYDGRTARDLTAEDFETDPRLKNYKYDPRYNYSGYLDSDLMKVAPGAAISLEGDPRAAFYRDLARQKVEMSGQPVTRESIDAQFYRDIADANKWALIDPTKQADQFALDNARTANDIWAHKQNAETDYQYYKLMHQNDDANHNIFREAERLANNANKNTAGGHVQYEMPEQYYQQIDPVIQASMTLGKNKETGETIPIYTFKGQDLAENNSVAYLGKDGNMHNMTVKNQDKAGDYTFIGSGNMRAKRVGTYRDGSPRYKYWISGKLLSPDGNEVRYKGDNPNLKDNSNTLWIPVKERGYNYGQTQKKQ